MAAIFDLTKAAGLPLANSQDVALHLYRQHQSHTSRRLKENAVKRQHIYRDNWEQHLENLLHQQFASGNYERLLKMRDTSFNVLKRVINRISIVYQDPPERYEVSAPASDNALQALHAEYDHIGHMNIINRLLSLHGVIMLRPVVRGGYPDIDIITPDMAEVATSLDNPYEPSALLYRVGASSLEIDPSSPGNARAQEHAQFVYMDSDSIFTMDHQGNIMKPQDGEDTVNPYGMLPIVTARRQVPYGGSFWEPHHANDLVQGTLQIGVLLTYLNNAIKTSSFKQIYISAAADNSEIAPDQIMDPTTPLALPDASVGLLDMQINLQSIVDSINFKIEQLATSYGISIDEFKLQGQPQSGFAREIANDALIKEVQSQQRAMLRVERDLYRMQATVYNVNSLPRVGQMDAEANLDVDYAELDFGKEGDTVQYQLDKEQMRDGLLSLVDLYRKYVNTDVGEDAEVIERLKEIKAQNTEARNSSGLGAFSNADVAPPIGVIE